MALKRSDQEFRHLGVTHVDFHQLDMDRVLTGLLPRLWYGGAPSVLHRDKDLSVSEFVDTITQHPHLFTGFDPEVAYRWVETHLLDMVNRGKPTQSVAGLRPLHGFTYRFRNARRSRPYGADEQLYAMIKHAREGPKVLPLLKDFFFAAVDPHTGRARPDVAIDVEAQALINLWEAAEADIHDREDKSRRNPDHPPLLQDACDLLADDLMRLLFHEELIPRSVLVDYVKILFAFHLALYHLRLLKALPAQVSGQRTEAGAALFLDVQNLPGTATARLAERSAEAWFDRIPKFVQAGFTVKKLDEFARHLIRRKKMRQPTDGVLPVQELLSLLGAAHTKDRDTYAETRLQTILGDNRGDAEDLDPSLDQIQQLGLDPFTTYVEIVTHLRVGFHRRRIRECLDSMLLKNKPGAMLTQPRNGQRRFTLDSRVVEVLLQIALLREGGSAGFHTAALRVDEFLDILRTRYGLFIDQLPPGDGFDRPSITDQEALRDNARAFTARLREIGFYSDLSDAYLTQTISPRYIIQS
ncbi:hypothetical protein LP52_18205 [Streptomonospora alba]|uniref:Uncharacterized protein n=1 Tax=Streptomonospora alba TaxID=183763 RepID=A0A0C2G2Y6_9ACTN|nr:hypothetical protein [Streptomonospora alba]KIH97638.1 hypothetical protein LP52_18205 [Streptomonospora alba]